MQSANVDILLIEDRPEDAELTRLALESAGFTGDLKWLKDGQEAMDFLFEETPPSVLHNLKFILLDLNLPKYNGIEILKRIKNSPLKRIPVVMLTTSIEDQDIMTAYDNYVNSYVRKPVDFEEFQDFIASLGKYWVNYNARLA